MFHSNSSPFNQRQPKAGPSTVTSRFLQETSQKSTADFLKRGSTPSGLNKMLSPRPIITNSRVKQDEKYKLDMYLAFVNNALLRKSKGDGERFDELVSQFTATKQSSGTAADNGDNSLTQLRLWMLALCHVVSQLERTHSALVDAVIAMPWTMKDSQLVQAYVAFIGMLASARPEYLSMVLERTARGFTFHSVLRDADSNEPEGSFRPMTRRVVYERLHILLQHLVSLIPTLPKTLQPLLVRYFPHKREDKIDQVAYIRNLLHITEYCPELSDRILATIIDHAIQIDVEIQVEMEELEGEDTTRDDSDIFTHDPFDILVGQEGDDSEEEDDDDPSEFSDISSEAGGDPDDDTSRIPQTDMAHVRDMITKLDAMLKLVFDYFHKANISLVTTTLRSATDAHDPPPDITFTSSPARPPPVLVLPADHGRDLRRQRFMSLLAIFDRTIIRTFKSRYTQFLIFWYASLDPQYADMFQGLLVSRALFEETEPLVTRVAAASYIAGFVSRAKFVGKDSTRRVVGLLCEFLEHHLDAFGTIDETNDALETRHTMFYAVAQAVFLIFCFRWRDLHLDDEIEMDDFGIDNSAGKKWIPKLDVMQRVVTSSLNPLKVCSQNVVQQFARVTKSTGFLYCYTVLESNRRSELQGSNTSTPHNTSQPIPTRTPVPLRGALDADLNTFFPFDPYKLPLSCSYIHGVYREWSSVALDDDEDDDEDDDAEDAPDDSSTRRPWGLDGQEDDAGALGTSFEGMSISPVRPLVVSRQIG